VMKSLRESIFPGRSERQPTEPNSRIHSRSHAGAKPQSAQAQNISKHPVIRILLRIDELQRQDRVGPHITQQAQRNRAELEACLAAIHKGAN
jgi:hypothetical protein